MSISNGENEDYGKHGFSRDCWLVCKRTPNKVTITYF